MNTFQLEIVTPDGLLYSGSAQRLIIRTTEGDVGILANHTDYVAPLDIGIARILTEDGEKKAACSGGLVSVSGSDVRVVATTFEWAENIDVARAERAKEKAQSKLSAHSRTDYEYKLAQIKLKKSLARLSASERR